MHPAVQRAIASLVAEGKTPTVALTKARLREPVPMPMVIAGLSAYKNDPSIIQTPIEENIVQNNEQTSQLDRIEQKLDRLLQLLEKD
jgi:hypothetical protein